MDRIRRSWDLARSSWAVVREHRELLVLPVISAVAAVLCAAPFFASALLLAVGGTRTSPVHPGLAGYALMFVGYLVGSYVALLFQSALVHAANERLAGGSPTLVSALRGAIERAGELLPWALLSATVSVVLRAVQERSGLLGRIVTGLLGVAWTLVTFLVLPIIVVEGVGVREAMSHSAAAFRATWGEQVAGHVGIGLVTGLAALAGVVVLAPVFWVGASTGAPALVLVAVVLLAVWLLVVAVVSSALGGVYRTALYRFAVLGEEPAGFSAAQIRGAFTPKR